MGKNGGVSMMRTSARLLKEAYPVLLFISLLMSWELTGHGSRESPLQEQKSRPSWSFDLQKPDPVCNHNKPNQLNAGNACTLKEDSLLPLRQRKTRFPWETVPMANAQRASAGWEAL